MRLFTLTLFNLIIVAEIISQNLPSQWKITDDGRYLIAGNQPSEGLYDETKIEEIRLYFPQSNYWALLTQNYTTKIDIPCKLKYKGIEYDSVGVRFKGQTSYFANTTQKKSFNISMDTFITNQKLVGYKTLNLNNSWQDPSSMREVLYYRLIRNHSQSAKANFVRLFINDQDWGVYLNVQQLNKDFLEEWYESNDGINMRADRPDGSSTAPGGPGGQWGDGTAGLNYLGTDTAIYQKYYTLKSADIDKAWPELVKACNILNNSGANLEKNAPDAFDIDKILWHLACEIAFTDDDSYVFKGKMDYYIYQDAETRRWTSYDYDANSTFSTPKISTWPPFYNETKINYPLLNKLLSISAFRQRYLAHMRTIIKELMDETKVSSIIDSYDNLIRTIVLSDTKKITTLTAYNNALLELKNFIRNRKAYLLANAEVNALSPVISDAQYTINDVAWGKVSSNNEVKVTARVMFGGGINNVILHYGRGIAGLFTKITMFDNGNSGDKISGDGVYTAIIPQMPPGSLVKFYIEAIGNDIVKSRSYFPSGAEHQLMTFYVTPSLAAEKTIVINEFMASNNGIVKDEAGENDDWIELYNITNKDINMSGYYITDNPANLQKFKLAENTIIKAGGYLVLWADEDQEQGPLHTNFKLSSSGEVIYLLDNKNIMLDSITFGPQIADKSSARKPNGTGKFEIGNHTLGTNNNGISSLNEVGINNIKIYPNPATTGNIKIENMGDQFENISIFHINGVIVSKHIIPASSQIDLEIIQPGIYIIRSNHKIKKLVVTQK